MLIHHHLATTPELPPITASLYDYVIAGNGIFKRARRELMSASIPIRSCAISGLALIKPELTTHFDRVPEVMVAEVLDIALAAARKQLEVLCYLSWDISGWQLEVPRQIQTYDSVAPVETGAGSPYERAIIEIHSHHRMPATFSPEDDRDESGFRIYGVIGHLNPERDYWPEINLRLGVYGNWWPLPAGRILAMPLQLNDRNAALE